MAVDDDVSDLLAEIEEGIREEWRKSCLSTDLVVYCDQHLGVEMVRSVSWLLTEIPDRSADCNVLELWRCPKQGCNRCYDPTVYGYFGLDAGMGSRIQPNTTEQIQCYRHEKQAFMYIHKIEQDRRFCCPFCKCDEKRDFVAMSVTDEIVALPGDPLVGLGKAQGKRALEMAVFESFASASGIRLDVASVRNVDPPHPDIFCTIACKPHWFELGRIISEELAAKINPRRYKSEGAFSFSQESAFTKIVAKKAKKSYETRGAPVDLILHFDLRLGTNSAISGLINQDAKLLQPLTKNGRFARVWIFDEWAKSILWPLTLS